MSTKAELEQENARLRAKLNGESGKAKAEPRLAKARVKVKDDGILLIAIDLKVDGVPYEKKNGSVRSKAITGDLGRRQFMDLGHGHFFDVVIGKKLKAEKWKAGWHIEAS